MRWVVRLDGEIEVSKEPRNVTLQPRPDRSGGASEPNPE